MKRRLIASLAIALMLVATLALPVIAADSADVTASVTVTSVISITITGAAAGGISFGSLAPGATDVLETHSNNVTPSIIVTNNGNSTVTLQIKGTDFGASFPVTNAKYNLSYNDSKTAMSSSYATVSSIAPTGATTIWHWLDVPLGVTAASYSSNFTYKAQ